MAAISGSALAIGLAVSLAATAISTGMQVYGARQQAKSQKAFANFNARQAEIRAKQTDTAARESLEYELGSIMAARAANNLGGSLTGRSIMEQATTTRMRERRVAVGNEMQRAQDFRNQARMFAAQGRQALVGGLVSFGTKAAQSFALYAGGAAGGGGYPTSLAGGAASNFGYSASDTLSTFG